MVFLIDIPAAAGLFILSIPIIRILFERGLFTDKATIATAGALQMFALGIPFVSGVRNLVPAFFALRSPKTPVAIATIALFANAALALILMRPMLHVGLALAMASSAAVNFFLLLYLFRRKVGKIGGRKMVFSVGRTLIATAIMSLFLIAAIHYGNLFEVGGILYQAGTLAILIIICLILYIAIIRIISPEEYHALINMIKRRKKEPATSADVNV